MATGWKKNPSIWQVHPREGTQPMTSRVRKNCLRRRKPSGKASPLASVVGKKQRLVHSIGGKRQASQKEHRHGRGTGAVPYKVKTRLTVPGKLCEHCWKGSQLQRAAWAQTSFNSKHVLHREFSFGRSDTYSFRRPVNLLHRHRTF